MTNPVRLGVIGAGWWATEAHIPGILDHPDARLVALCDPHAGRLAEAAKAYNIETTYADYREMLDREALDAAIVVTPHATHYELGRACLDRGLHLLIEKPMTLIARDARDLVQTARDRSLTLMTGYNYNYYPQAQRAHAAVLNGELGEVEYLDSSFASDMTNFFGGNVSPGNPPLRYGFKVHGPSENYNNPKLLGGGQGHLQLTHSIGLLFYVTGLRAQRVQALMNNLGRKVDMVDAFSVGFKNGAVGQVGGTGNAGQAHRMALIVYCTDGCIMMDSLAQVSFIRKKDGSHENLLELGTAKIGRHPTTTNFIDVILGRDESHATGEVGWRAVELLDAAYRSASNNGQSVDVEELYA
jgi:predicted dehydrogenase